MARQTVSQVVQVGRETTRGTTVPANKKLGSLFIGMNPAVESEANRTKGNKYATSVSANKEWSEGDLSGTATYDEIVYPLSSVFTAAAVAQIMDGATPTGVYEWVFSPSTSGIDAPVTFTVEEGDATQAERASHVMVKDFSLEMNRGEVGMEGAAIGQRITTGVSLTANATAVATDLVPILPGAVCIYLADTQAALSVAGASDPTKRQGKALSIGPSVSGRFDPVWYLNCSLASWDTFVEAPEPDFDLEYMVEADANGLAWLANWRSGKTQFVRIEATGPLIYDGATLDVPYLFRWDFAVKCMKPGDKSDEDGVYAISPEMVVVHDPTWGRATQVTVRCKTAAL